MHNLARKLRVLVLGSFVSIAAVALPQVNVLTYHNDNTRVGVNNAETKLTLSNVNSSTFGFLFSDHVDGQVYAEPLYMAALAIPGKGTHNVVFVCTENNSVYAFDADTVGAALWQVNLGPCVPYGDTGSNGIAPIVGITATPVIAPANINVSGSAPTLYVEAKTKELNGSGNVVYYHRLHALNVLTGAEMFNGPVIISATVPGTGDGTNGSGQVPFNALIQLCRPALLLVPADISTGRPAVDTVYLAFASHGDKGPYHGWIFAYAANTLQQLAVLNTTPNATSASPAPPEAAGGIWQGGAGMASDGYSVYATTGNGTFDPTTGSYADSILRMNPNTLQIKDYFTPSNQVTMNDYDEDLGSTGPILLPTEVSSTTGLNVDMIVQVSKNGSLYLVSRANLGQYNSSKDQIAQEMDQTMGGVFGCPAYFNGRVYIGPEEGKLEAWNFSGGEFTQGSASAMSPTSYGYPGPVPAISSNGTANGIVWAIESDAATSGGPAILHAYNAGNIAIELYNGSATQGRDTMGGAVKFSCPTIANGKVYGGTANAVDVFGLGQWAATPTMSPVTGTYTTSTQTSMGDTTAGSTIYYTTDGSTPTTSSTKYTVPVTFTSTVTVTARAFASNMGAGGIVANTYTIN